MNRKGVIVPIIIGLVIIGGGLLVNKMFKDEFGVSLIDWTISFFKSKSFIDAPNIYDVKDLISEEQFNNYLSQKEQIDGLLNSAKEQISVVNNDSDITSLLRTALGDNYSIYLFSVATIGNVSFKVVEWSIIVNNGTIVNFTNGSILSNYDVSIQLNQSAAYKLINGDVSEDDMINWIKNNDIKIIPITEVGRFIKIVPQITALTRK